MSAVIAPKPVVPGSSRWETVRDGVVQIGRDVAGPCADSVDRDARFPEEAITALRGACLFSAVVPHEHGGEGLTLSQQCEVAYLLSQHCAATGMIWAMHCIQVACLARHHERQPWLLQALRSLCVGQGLIASVTSEVGVGGAIATSITAIERGDPGAALCKQASTISYGQQADAFLVTARAHSDTEEQSLVLIDAVQARLTPRGAWDTLGMRGTCSPAFEFAAEFALEQILPNPFSVILADTMVPYSHTLWASCWLGIARGAMLRARAFARKSSSGAGPSDRSFRLAEAAAMWQSLYAEVFGCIGDVERSTGTGAARTAPVSLALRLNNLKVNASQGATRIVTGCLAVTGMAGYRNGTPYSVGRHLRDALSAACMIGNDRLLTANADLMLIQKEDAPRLSQ